MRPLEIGVDRPAPDVGIDLVEVRAGEVIESPHQFAPETTVTKSRDTS